MSENRSFRRPAAFAALATLTLVSMVTAGAWAFGPHGHGPDGDFHEFMVNKMLDRADATDEQRTQILAILRAAHTDVTALREESPEQMHERMLELFSAETIDRDAIDALQAEHQARRAVAMGRMTDAIVEAANLLSQEQRVAIAEGMRERFAEHGARRHGPRD